MKAWKKSAGDCLNVARTMIAIVALLQSFFGPLAQSAQAEDKTTNTHTIDAAASLPTATPIKHVIVIVGENRSFDHLFATYQPKPGNTVNNLLSEGIIQSDGSPGPNYSIAQQYSADVSGSSVFELSPTTGKTPYTVLPPPLNGGPSNVCKDNGICELPQAYRSENGLSQWPINYYQYM